MAKDREMMAILKSWFPKTGLYLYCAGILAFTICIGTGELFFFHMPGYVHLPIGILAGFTFIGLILFWKSIRKNNLFETLIFSAMAVHLFLTSVLHFWSLIYRRNDWIDFFPVWYPWLTISYFLLFAYHLWKIEFDP